MSASESALRRLGLFKVITANCPSVSKQMFSYGIGSFPSTSSLSGGQDYLSMSTRLHDGEVGTRSVSERHHLADHRPECTVFQAGPERSVNSRALGLRSIEKRESEDGGVAHHGHAWINLHRAPAANDHHPPALGQHAQVFPQIYVGQHFQDDVHTAP